MRGKRLVKPVKQWRKLLAVLVGIAALVFLCTPVATQTAHAVVAALVQVVNTVGVQDIDNPARAPYGQFFETEWTPIQTDVLVTTVPAGKRLVIEYISYLTSSHGTDEFAGGFIRKGFYETNAAIVLEVHPPHASFNLGDSTQQDGSQMVKAYFDPGTEIWLRVFHTTNNMRALLLTLNGYYVNVP